MNPPTTSTFPLGNSVAVVKVRLRRMFAAGCQVPVLGWYSSASAPWPPTASTRPSGSVVAIW
ncbi:MAG: hypothetical protein ACRDT4_02475 [Micromonosporaceae bacterium]